MKILVDSSVLFLNLLTQDLHIRLGGREEELADTPRGARSSRTQCET